MKRAGNGWSSADAGECSLIFRSEIKVEICRSGGNISSEYAPREPPDIYLLYLFYTVYVVQSVHTKTYGGGRFAKTAHGDYRSLLGAQTLPFSVCYLVAFFSPISLCGKEMKVFRFYLFPFVVENDRKRNRQAEKERDQKRLRE